MSERTYRVTEIVGTSPEGIEPAIRSALQRAGQTLRHLDWFEVTQIRGQIVDGDVRALPGRPQGRLPAGRRLAGALSPAGAARRPGYARRDRTS